MPGGAQAVHEFRIRFCGELGELAGRIQGNGRPDLAGGVLSATASADAETWLSSPPKMGAAAAVDWGGLHGSGGPAARERGDFWIVDALDGRQIEWGNQGLRACGVNVNFRGFQMSVAEVLLDRANVFSTL